MRPPGQVPGRDRREEAAMAEEKRLPFSSDKPFTDVMADKEICREVVERCIGRKVEKVENVSPRRPRGVPATRSPAW